MDLKEAIKKVEEICHKHHVPVKHYHEDENDFPDGRQDSDDVISIKRSVRTRPDWDAGETRFEVTYYPWIRVMPNDLSIKDFDNILEQGQNVRKCVVDLNDFLSTTEIVTKERID